MPQWYPSYAARRSQETRAQHNVRMVTVNRSRNRYQQLRNQARRNARLFRRNMRRRAVMVNRLLYRFPIDIRNNIAERAGMSKMSYPEFNSRFRRDEL